MQWRIMQLPTRAVSTLAKEFAKYGAAVAAFTHLPNEGKFRTAIILDEVAANGVSGAVRVGGGTTVLTADINSPDNG